MNLLFFLGPLTGFFGVFVCYACLPEAPAPVGFIWFRLPAKNTVDILYVFTHEDFRRKGVATAMLEQIKHKFPKFDITNGKENEMSKPWLVKQGFIETTNNGWLLKQN